MYTIVKSIVVNKILKCEMCLLIDRGPCKVMTSHFRTAKELRSYCQNRSFFIKFFHKSIDHNK